MCPKIRARRPKELCLHKIDNMTTCQSEGQGLSLYFPSHAGVALDLQGFKLRAIASPVTTYAKEEREEKEKRPRHFPKHALCPRHLQTTMPPFGGVELLSEVTPIQRMGSIPLLRGSIVIGSLSS